MVPPSSNRVKVAKGNFHVTTTLSETSINDLTWLLEKAHMYPKPIRVKNPKHKLTTDVSDLGWGAVSVLYGKTGGKLSRNERDIHINAKEMLGVLNGLKHFFMNCTCATIHIESDNTTTVAYINKHGGCHSVSLNNIAKDIWSFAIDRNLWLVATHIPGKMNIVADKLSRNFAWETEWQLNPKSFKRLCEHFKFFPEIDWFASSENKQTLTYASWKQDISAFHIDAFTASWNNNKSYFFPPFSLLGPVISKIIEDKTVGIIITPNWNSQFGYPRVQKICLRPPLTLKPHRSLLTQRNKIQHPTWWKMEPVA